MVCTRTRGRCVRRQTAGPLLRRRRFHGGEAVWLVCWRLFGPPFYHLSTLLCRALLLLRSFRTSAGACLVSLPPLSASALQLNESLHDNMEYVKELFYDAPEGAGGSGVGGGGGGGGGGDRDTPARVEFVEAAKTADLFSLALHHLKTLKFELRKAFLALFSYLMHYDTAGFASDFMLTNISRRLHQMVDGYAASDCALIVGQMLRVCIDSQERLCMALIVGAVRTANTMAR